MEKSKRERERKERRGKKKKRKRYAEVKNSGKFQKPSFLNSNLKYFWKERFE
jgi:hypothetical protein